MLCEGRLRSAPTRCTWPCAPKSNDLHTVSFGRIPCVKATDQKQLESSQIVLKDRRNEFRRAGKCVLTQNSHVEKPRYVWTPFHLEKRSKTHKGILLTSRAQRVITVCSIIDSSVVVPSYRCTEDFQQRISSAETCNLFQADRCCLGLTVW